MTPTKNICYEFAGFVLNPKDRLLFQFERRVDLAGKDFDILLYMVQNPNVLIRHADLINAVWGIGNKIHQGNISNHVAKVRKALHCDPHDPRFIETTHGKKGYRFIAKVSQTDQFPGPFLPERQATREFQITSHLFIPVFLGSSSYARIAGSYEETQWIKYKEFLIDQGRLCILPCGIAVWHLTETNKYPTLSDVASWRKRIYHKILQKRHILSVYNKELIAPLNSLDEEIFEFVLGELGYVFSVLVLEAPSNVNPGHIVKPLEILSCLTPLEPTGLRSERRGGTNLEREFLDGIISTSDMREFGARGTKLGFASWDGLSYYQSSENSAGFVENIVEFEVAVQATWWFSKCLSDICLTRGANVKERLRTPIQELKWQFAKLQSIAATETTSQRTMSESVLATSRLDRLVEETIILYDQL